jgi:hypothetical protein
MIAIALHRIDPLQRMAAVLSYRDGEHYIDGTWRLSPGEEEKDCEGLGVGVVRFVEIQARRCNWLNYSELHLYASWSIT